MQVSRSTSLPALCARQWRFVRAAWYALVLVLVVGTGCGDDSAKAPVARVSGKSQAATVDLDESYVVMARKSAVIRRGSHIWSGNIGVNQDLTNWPNASSNCIQTLSNGTPDIRRCYASQDGSALRFERDVEASDGSKAFANTVRMERGTRLTDVYYKDWFDPQSGAVVEGVTQQVSSDYFPLFPALPTPKPVEASNDDTGASGVSEIRVLSGQLRCLAPGIYGDIRLDDDATLRFAADCSAPLATTAGSYVVRDIRMGKGAALQVGPGDVRIRDLLTGTQSTVSFGLGTVRVRDFRAAPSTQLALAPAAYHFRNFRTDAEVTTQFTTPDAVVDIMIANKLRIGRANMFNSTRVGSTLPSDVDGSLIRIYVHGRDEAAGTVGTEDPVDEETYPPSVVAVEIYPGTKFHANIMALGTGTSEGGTIHLRQNSIAIGSYFADHVIVGMNVELTNRNGLLGPHGGDPSYLDGDADNDSILDDADNCLASPNLDQVDADHDGVGSACDNCPSVGNPKQEVAFPGDPDHVGGSACQVPPLAYCGDGVVQGALGEECDLGFANHGDTRACSFDCLSNLPRIIAQPASQTVTEGAPVSFSVSATGRDLGYQWQRDGVDIPGATEPAYSLAATVHATDHNARFRVNVTNFAGSVLSAEAVLTVLSAAPVITTQPQPASAVEGGSATFSVTTQGSGLSYRWQKAGVNIAGATQATLTLTNLTLGDDGSEVRVVVSNASGTVTSQTATLSVTQAPPQITTHPAALTVSEGEPAEFSVTASGSGLTYQWQRNSTNIPGATSRLLAISTASLGDAGSYRVVVTNGAGGVTSTSADLTVVQRAPRIVSQPSSQTVQEGASASFAVVAQGSQLTYQWQANEVDIPGATAAQLTLNTVSADDDGKVFRVRVQNPAGSVVSSGATLSISLNAPRILTQPVDQTVDEGSPVTFAVAVAGTGLSYRWQRNGVNIPGATTASYTLVPTTLVDHEATFRCVISNAGGNTVSRTATLSVRQLAPTIQASPSSLTVLEGNTATFSVSASGSQLTYQWQKNNSPIAGATSASLVLNSVSYADNGANFRVVVSNAAGAVTSSAAQLIVNLRAPVIELDPSDQQVTEGQSVSFSVVARGTNLSYQWRRDGTPISGATSSTYTISQVAYADRGAEFSVIVTNSAGSATSRSAKLSVALAAPQILAQPANVTVDEGQSATLSVSATGTLISYQWRRNGTNIPGATGASYTFPFASLANEGDQFLCVVSNAAGAVTSSSATLSVRRLAPVIVTQPTSQSVLEGQPVTLSVVASGSDLTYRWRKDGFDIPGATAANYVIAAARLEDDGAVYTAVVTNPAGSVLGGPATLTVALAPPSITTQPVSVSVLERQPATFSAGVRGSLTSLEWQRNGVAIPGATSSSFSLASASLADDGAVFQLVASNAAGSVTSAQARLTVGLAPPVIAANPSPATVDEGQTASFTVASTGTATSVRWQKNGVDIPGESDTTLTIAAASFSDDGASYRAIVTNDAGAATSEAAQLTVRLLAPALISEPSDQTVAEGHDAVFSVIARATNASYQWLKNGVDLGGRTGTSLSLTDLTLSDSGSRYSVRITNAAGSVTSRQALLTINQLAPNLTSQPSNLAVDEGEQASFAVVASGSGLTYQWQKNGADIPGATSANLRFTAAFSDDEAGLRCVVTNGAGSVTSQSATLTVRLLRPVLSLGPSDLTVVEGQAASFSCTASGTLLSYGWTRNGQTIAGATASTYSLASAQLGDSGDLFRCVVSNAAGTVTSPHATLTVNLAPPVLVAQPSYLGVTERNPATFQVSAQGSQLSYQWLRSNVEIPGANEPTYTLASASLDDHGALFSVRVMNGAGQVTSRQALLSVAMAAPVITHHPQSQTATEGSSVNLSCAAQGSFISYRWQRDGVDIPGALSASYTVSPVTFEDAGHSLRCVAENAAGTAYSDGANLTVILLPPVITSQPVAQSVLEGDRATFSCAASGTNTTTRWQRDAVDIPGATSATYTTPVVSISDQGARLRCVVTNTRASVVSDEATLTVLLKPPVIAAEPAHTNVTEGARASFSVSATGTNLSYQWQKNGTNIPGATSPTYTTAPVTYADHGAVYGVTVQNSGGSVESRGARLDVSLLPPRISQHPSSQQALVGDSITFTCQATGTLVSYRWQRAGVDVSSASTSSLTITATQDDHSVAYECVASNSAGEATSQAAVLDVVQCIASRFTSTNTTCGTGACADTGRTSCTGNVIVDSCVPGTTSLPTCNGTQVISCVNGQDHASECSDADTCNGAETCSSGRCRSGTPPVVDDGNPCTADSCSPSSGVEHVVLALGTSCGSSKQCDAGGSCITISPPTITQAPANLSANIGASATFTVSANGGNLSYQWLRLGEAIAGATSTSYTRTPVRLDDHNSQYSVRVTNSVGTVTSAPANLTVVDTVGPVVRVDGSASRETTGDFINLSGDIRDAGVGILSLDVRSDRYGSTLFGASISGERFAAQIPLQLGSNNLTFIARDQANNTSQVVISVTSGSTALPRLSIDSPVDGSRTQNAQITVSGRVRSSLSPNQIRLVLGNQVIFPEGSGAEYGFSFPNVALSNGPNLISVRAETTYGSVVAQAVVERGEAPATSQNEPPQLSVIADGTDLYNNGASVLVSGTASDERCIAQVTANGVLATLTGQGSRATFDAEVPFPMQTSELLVHVVARDCDNGESMLDYTVRRDDVAPVIRLQNLLLSPATNPAVTTPYPVSGTISELNLAGFSANEQSIGVLPTGSGDYTFTFDVPLVRGQTRALNLEAWDFAGNRSEVSVNLTFDAQLDLQVVAPADGSKYMLSASSQTLEVVARAPGLAAGDRVVVLVDNTNPVNLNRTESIARGEISLDEGEHTLTVRAESSTGQLLSAKTVKVSVLEQDDVPLALTSTDPKNGATGVEGNTSLNLTFSRPVPDPTKLTLRVLETVHGEIYGGEVAGADMRTLTEPQLVRVDRDRQLVLGALTILPGADGATFESETELAYGARVEVDVLYDGQSIGKSTYAIRPMPTLASGVVYDSNGEPVANLEVLLEEAGRRTVTDKDGAFSFGFGEGAEQDLSGGAYHLKLNPGSKNATYAAVDRLVNLEPGRHTSLGALHTYLISQRTPYREIASGSPNVLFDSGRLSLNLSSANITLPNGASSGPVHVQPVRMNQTSFQAPAYAVVSWLYAVQPLGIEVTGSLGVTMEMSQVNDSYDYVSKIGARVLLIGRDPDTLRLGAVGVATVDAQTHRITSEGTVALRNLDAIGYGIVVPEAQELLAQYGRGAINLQTLNAVLNVAAP